ncbi:conserved membrane hypothetical protein [Hyella patelloides LEGE 07179]|uniref:Glycosyltransferase RgtA/B/C/D-like domain-containing protein n=1 Tax=Hyella patelloides LEGE 07179 TaxID=945734 RepID=A0A563W5J4_9CYAN|nr:hypothetical protein [Hyella patelloides]VEP18925.1 conserved membrane hypothetical protein [Hyella patelloides LEGE 07179]
MNIQLKRSQQKFLFLLLITTIYTALVIWLDFLHASKLGDEGHFWKTSLTFSESLIPTIDQLKNYGELNTPLPFILFGGLEYLFQQGIFAGRLLNLILSLITVFIIGWPSRDKGGKAILSLLGLFSCPFYLLTSGRLFTDMIACFCVLVGFLGYVHNRHLLSCIAFILAIASRQYMLAFPVAIAIYELMVAFTKIKSTGEFNLSAQWRWIAPFIAALSILGWIYLFQGLAPSTGLEEMAPEFQQTTWYLKPNRAVYFLAFVSIFIVIPEFILFQPLARIQSLKQQWRKILLIAVGWLLYCLIFQPPTSSDGKFEPFLELLHYEFLKIALFYVLSLLACVRFSQPNLMFLCVLVNCFIMMKAHYWSKYVLPLAIVFWYLKSLGLEEKFSFSGIISKWSILGNKRRSNQIKS